MIKRFKDQYFGSAFARNIMVMFTGNGLSLILPFLLAPLITRLFSPEDFAGYELFAKLIALVGVLAALRYEYAIILPADDDEAEGIVLLSLRILILVTLLSGIFFIPFRFQIGAMLDNQDLPGLLWWLPPGIFLTGLLLIFGQYITRKGLFKLLASNKVIATTGNHFSKYLIGFRFPTSGGLVTGHLIGLLAPVLAILAVRPMRQLIVRLHSNTQNMRALAVKYKEFPLINSTHAFYDEAQKTLLLFMISAYYGEYVFGLFAFTFRYLRIPVQVFGSSLSQVVMPRFASDLNAGISIKPKIVRIMVMLALIGILPFAALMVFGEELFTVFFSSEWSEAGRYAAIMAPWLFFNFIVSPISLLPTVVARQRTFFAISVSFTIVTIAGVFIMARLDYEFYSLLIFMTLIGALMDAFLAYWFIHIASLGRKIVSQK
jgi:O-antigen/teichoic acid export membrane protein